MLKQWPLFVQGFGSHWFDTEIIKKCLLKLEDKNRPEVISLDRKLYLNTYIHHYQGWTLDYTNIWMFPSNSHIFVGNYSVFLGYFLCIFSKCTGSRPDIVLLSFQVSIPIRYAFINIHTFSIFWWKLISRWAFTKIWANSICTRLWLLARPS